ncbi:hypothetical protein WEH80_32480 [Actinomycetes bacterium KLBMP 9759]
MQDLAIEASDEPLRPDQYTFVETHAWWLGSFGRHNHLAEHRVRQWIPARPEREWLLVRELTGEQEWLTGSAEEAAEEGYDPFAVGPVGTFRAAHGEFDLSADPEQADADHVADAFCVPPAPPRRGSWQSPTKEFFARLPLDPVELRERLQDDNPGSWFGPFAAAVTALRTCLVPAGLRGALYRALRGLPAVTLATGVRNLDGLSCIALIHDAGRTRTELMIDPLNGQFAGERDTLRMDARCGLGVGAVISSTAVATAPVDAPGQLPLR